MHEIAIAEIKLPYPGIPKCSLLKADRPTSHVRCLILAPPPQLFEVVISSDYGIFFKLYLDYSQRIAIEVGPVDFVEVLEVTRHQDLDLIVIQPQSVQGHLYPPELWLLLHVQHPRYPVVAEIEDLHALQGGQLRVRDVGELVPVQVEVYQMRHAVPEHGRVDLLQVVLPQIEHVQVGEAGERVRRKFVDRVTSQAQLLQRILQAAPIIRGDLRYLVTCRGEGTIAFSARIL